MLFNHRELARTFAAAGSEGTQALLREAFELHREGKPGGVDPHEVRTDLLAEAIFGHDAVFKIKHGASMHEAAAGVNVTAFANIIGQQFFSSVMEAYQNEAFVFSGLVPSRQTRFNGEKIPGIAPLPGGTVPTVDPGTDYPAMGFGEDYVETPATVKRGFTVPVQKEAVFFDLTGNILQQASEVGEVMGVDKEKRIIAVAIGAVANHRWKGTDYATYSADGSTGVPSGTPISGLINHIANNPLVDWSDVDEVEQLFNNILNPTTGEPVVMSVPSIVAAYPSKNVLERILTASEIRTTTNTNTVTVSRNPVGGAGYNAYASRQLYRRIMAPAAAGGLNKSASIAGKSWLMGDFKKAFAYMENWGVTPSVAAPNSEAEFRRDIVAEYKVTERAVAACINPRYVVLSLSSS